MKASRLMDVGQWIVSVSPATRAFSFLFFFFNSCQEVFYTQIYFWLRTVVEGWVEVLFSVPWLCLCQIKLHTKTFSLRAEALSILASYSESKQQPQGLQRWPESISFRM